MPSLVDGPWRTALYFEKERGAWISASREVEETIYVCGMGVVTCAHVRVFSFVPLAYRCVFVSLSHDALLLWLCHIS